MMLGSSNPSRLAVRQRPHERYRRRRSRMPSSTASSIPPSLLTARCARSDRYRLPIARRTGSARTTLRSLLAPL